MIYLDNAATTPVYPEVAEKMSLYMTGFYENPGAVYNAGREAKKAVEEARASVAEFFGCSPANVVFTSGGSEGNNMILRGVYDWLSSRGKTHLVVSATEHDSVLRTVEYLRRRGYLSVSYVEPSADGVIHADAVRDKITADTGLISVMYANNETGSVNEIAEIGKLCYAANILFHSDCVQSAGLFPIDVERNGMDFAVISGHKIHGPKGVGAVYVRDPSVLTPLVFGGLNQEHGLRGGTENVPGIVGLGEACRISLKDQKQDMVRMSTLKQVFLNTLRDRMGGELEERGVFLNGTSYFNAGKTVDMRVDGVSGETLVLCMDSMGVCISSGSACRARESEPSRTLLAFGLSPEQARSSFRVSFSVMNTIEEAESAANILADCINALRKNDT